MSESKKTMMDVMDRLWWQARSEVFEEENAELRELVRAMWFLLCVTGNNDLVAEVGKNGETMWTVDATAIAEKMRELGIEVRQCH